MTNLLLGGMIMVSTGVIVRECGGSRSVGLMWSICGVSLLIWSMLLNTGLI
jgi:hypothetical protein